MTDFKKISELVGSEITIKESKGFKYKMWDNDNKKMLVSKIPHKGYRKIYSFVVYAGQDYQVDFSSGQVSQMFEGAMQGLTANLQDKTFAVKSNGKTGMDIRYFFNLVNRDEEQITTEDLEASGLFDY